MKNLVIKTEVKETLDLVDKNREKRLIQVVLLVETTLVMMNYKII